ncbi:hypothetical protein [Nonomuraea jiangxiensis]|uniref:Uncharacterized protein n=1 Tax=Nonomuraea jiangxiensis TaxID=633440 RepID=A0A1G8QG88_9ACTN|nr:hypothetical protein [Nonomuraea jiangxiensis]SDJ03658.1 hypothetical protein SAMN05421869_108233 [Nonomuraea jiangxiensis]
MTRPPPHHPRSPWARPRRHPPDPAITRRYLWFCLIRFLVLGAIAATVFLFTTAGVPDPAKPFVAACATATASCLALSLAAATGLARRPLPALVPLALALWGLGVLTTIVITVDEGGRAWGTLLIGCLILLASRPPLALRTHLANNKGP